MNENKNTMKKENEKEMTRKDKVITFVKKHKTKIIIGGTAIVGGVLGVKMWKLFSDEVKLAQPAKSFEDMLSKYDYLKECFKNEPEMIQALQVMQMNDECKWGANRIDRIFNPETHVLSTDEIAEFFDGLIKNHDNCGVSDITGVIVYSKTE